MGTLDPAGPMTSFADSAAFDPFGKAVATTGTKHSVGFQGDWTDPDTDQVNMTARWYSPETGGFASRDDHPLPTSPSGMANRYTYGLGAPTNYSHPSGTGPSNDGWCLCPPRPRVDDWFDGDWLSNLLPIFCNPEEGGEPILPGGLLPPPPGDTGRNTGYSGDNSKRGTGQGRRQPDPAIAAREQAREVGCNNPLPVAEALAQPLYGGDRTPPVSSSPQVQSHLAGDFANPVEDVNRSYSTVYAQLLEQNGSVVANISASLKSPVWLTEQNSGNDCPAVELAVRDRRSDRRLRQRCQGHGRWKNCGPVQVVVDPWVPLTAEWEIDDILGTLTMMLRGAAGGRVQLTVGRKDGVLMRLAVTGSLPEAKSFERCSPVRRRRALYSCARFGIMGIGRQFRHSGAKIHGNRHVCGFVVRHLWRDSRRTIFRVFDGTSCEGRVRYIRSVRRERSCRIDLHRCGIRNDDYPSRPRWSDLGSAMNLLAQCRLLKVLKCGASSSFHRCW
ncbi:RHS repeat-associated core domain-containing protein [Actinosynnema sp. NPDC050436]|uniref:RHS repeat-associated core domain-containing protein n=1 Tax=Actinosynnema sp. NPDC050436 TaxID=3155659 RepID=UPI00340E7BA1